MYESPKTGSLEIKGAYKGSTPARRCYVGGTLVYQGFGPASEQEFVQQEATGGPAQLLKVYGKTIVNNQLMQNYDFSDGTTGWSTLRSSVSVSGGVATITPTTNNDTAVLNKSLSAYLVIGHKYFRRLIVKGNANAVNLYVNGIVTGPTYLSALQITGEWQEFSHIQTAETTSSSVSFGQSKDSQQRPFYLKSYIVIDLTLRFGAGHEPTSVDEALRLLGGDAFDPTYDPGSLQSNKTAELRAYDGGTLRGSLALNLSTLTSGGVVVFPDGLRGVGSIRDEAEGSTGVVRFGKRAYQAGDESDTSVLTDGTNTIYPLATPLTYLLDTPLPTDLTCEQGDILQRVSDNNCPFVGEMKFGL